MTQYGDIDMGEHWLHKYNTKYTNVDNVNVIQEWDSVYSIMSKLSKVYRQVRTCPLWKRLSRSVIHNPMKQTQLH